MRRTRILLFLFMIGVGLGLGLLYGWVVNPVKYQDTTPDRLRSDYKADYVLMVAQIYQSDQNLEQVSRRLAVLGNLPPERIVAGALLTARDLGYTPDDLEAMEPLVQALQSVSPSPTAGSQP